MNLAGKAAKEEAPAAPEQAPEQAPELEEVKLEPQFYLDDRAPQGRAAHLLTEAERIKAQELAAVLAKLASKAALSLREKMVRRGCRLHCQLVGGRVTGYVLTEKRSTWAFPEGQPPFQGKPVARETTCHVCELAVCASVRRRGLGAALLTAAMRAVAAEAPGTVFSLRVDSTAEGTVRLYKRCGFRETRREADYYDAGRDALFMEAACPAGAGSL